MSQLMPSNSRIPGVRITAWVLGGLLLLTSLGLLYVQSDRHKVQNDLADQALRLDDLEITKNSIARELNMVEVKLCDSHHENDSLSRNLRDKLVEVKTLKNKLSSARKALNLSEDENIRMKSRLAEIERLTANLEADMASLEASSEALRSSNTLLKEELHLTRKHNQRIVSQVKDMTSRNKQLVEHLYRIAPAGFVADNFMIAAEQRNNKLTNRARKVDELIVSFDVNNVPEFYQEPESIYVVLTEFDGRPVTSIPTKQVRINAREPLTIEASAQEKILLKENQHFDMKVITNRDLESGMYNLLVYADHGFLGATSVQFR